MAIVLRLARSCQACRIPEFQNPNPKVCSPISGFHTVPFFIDDLKPLKPLRDLSGVHALWGLQWCDALCSPIHFETVAKRFSQNFESRKDGFQWIENFSFCWKHSLMIEELAERSLIRKWFAREKFCPPVVWLTISFAGPLSPSGWPHWQLAWIYASHQHIWSDRTHSLSWCKLESLSTLLRGSQCCLMLPKCPVI